MKIIGITGGIASGKTFLVNILKSKNFKVFEADLEVSNLYDDKDVIKSIGLLFPNVIDNGKINKNLLRSLLISEPSNFLKLENIFHPIIKNKRDLFIKNNLNQKIIFIEAPLFFEDNYQEITDKVIVVIADQAIRKKRALARNNMNDEIYEIMSLRQISDDDKKRMADYIINSNNDDNDVESQLDKIINEILNL